MNSLQFIADVHISPLTVMALQQADHNILRSEFARVNNRIVLTQDLDFSALVALGGYSQPSLVTLRLSSAQPDLVSKKLLEVLPQLEQVLIEGAAITIEDNTVRYRRLPIG